MLLELANIIMSVSLRFVQDQMEEELRSLNQRKSRRIGRMGVPIKMVAEYNK